MTSVSEDTVSPSDNTPLTCVASGNPVPSVVWVHNNNTILPQEAYVTDGIIDSLPNITVVVEVPAGGSSGAREYICVATTVYNDTDTFSSQESLFIQASKCMCVLLSVLI